MFLVYDLNFGKVNSTLRGILLVLTNMFSSYNAVQECEAGLLEEYMESCELEICM